MWPREARPASRETGLWCVFEDPILDAHQAAPAWTKTVCDEILPVVSGERPLPALRSSIDLDRLSCRVQVIEDREVTHIVFADQGRQLQLEMHTRPNAGAGIFTPAVSDLKRELISVVRFKATAARWLF